jgi:phage-related protein
MSSIGSSVKEIRIRETSGAFCIVYVASFAEAVVVLHAFQKKTQKTTARDVALATMRFRELSRSLKK